MSDLLKTLADNRDNIMLAEIGAMIHNIGKMSREHLIDREFNVHLYFGDFLYDLIKAQPHKTNGLDTTNINKASGKFYSQQLKSLLTDLKISFQTSPLNDRDYELREYSSLRIKKFYDDKILDNLLGGKTSLLGKLLAEAHGRAVGGDKGFTLDKININQQDKNFIHLSSAFGHEVENISKRNVTIEQACFLLNLQTLLKRVNEFISRKKTNKTDSEEEIKFWSAFHLEFHQTLKKYISPYIADTRYPINDVDLYSFHHSTASFYKAGIAKILLEQPSTLTYDDIGQFEWKLLSVRYNGLDYLMQARGVNDILGKQRALKMTLDAVKSLLEIEYPLSNEVYRDENGSVFLFPALEEHIEEDVLEQILKKIEDVFKKELQKELKPAINLSESSRFALKLGEVISKFTPQFNQFYPDLSPGQSKITMGGKTIQVDLCQSCHQRFMGYGLTGIALEKAVTRKICGVCYEHREKRAKNWWDEENHKTIWMDEVADEHGQVALIAGKFDLSNWLNGWWLNSMLTNSIHEIHEKENNISDYRDLLKKFDDSIANRYEKLSDITGKKRKNNPTYQVINEALSANFSFLNEYNNRLVYELLKDVPDPFCLFMNFKLTEQSLENLKKEKEALKKNTLEALTQIVNQEFRSEYEFLNCLQAKIEEEQFEKHKEKILKHAINFKDGRALHLISNSKKVSFARLARIWQQTRQFNQNIPSLLESCMGSIKRQRLIIKAADESSVPAHQKSFKSTHVYEFKMGNVSFSLYCIKGSEGGNRELEFASATNWQYLEKQFHFNWQQKLTKGAPLEETQEKLRARIESVEIADKVYYSYVTILAEPQLFMFLAPAAQAVDIVSMIKQHYDEQFSKVKNRLPLNLAVIFAKRRQPLYTILEAGRKMLAGFDNKPIPWQVQNDVCFDDTSKKAVLELQALRRENETNKHDLKWEVSARLGAPTKTDFYYPYFYTDFSQEQQIGNRTDVFKAPLPPNDSTWRYVCHVKQLKKDDRVYVTPAFFDFEFLEVPGRRFDLYYRDNVRWLRKSKPFLLDEMDQLVKAWQLVSNGGLTNAQFRGLLEVVEGKCESWFRGKAPDAPFNKFVKYTIHTQAKEWYQSLTSEEQALILEFSRNGRLLDVYELFMKILKRRLKEE